MARYGYSSGIGQTPILFDHQIYNLNMRYNNGIFIIEEPGYYRIGISSYSYDGKTDSKYVGFHAKINSLTKLSQDEVTMLSWSTKINVLGQPFTSKLVTPVKYSRWGASVQRSAIFYLNAFDTVYVAMTGTGNLDQGENMNDIQIENIV